WAGYRATPRVARQRATLGQIYEFTQSLARGSLDSAGLAAALDQVRELFNATTALLYVKAAPEPPLVVCSQDSDAGEAPEARDFEDVIVRHALASSAAVRVGQRGGTEADRRALRARGATEVIVASFRLGGATTGYVELRDRLSSDSPFAEDDLRSLDNPVVHLASAIENQRLVDQLRHQAYHDRLTGLPNRQRFVMAVDEAIREAKQGAGMVAVVLLDLDAFKDVNDALGHDYGDELLRMVGKRLREQAGERGLAARMGADEFAVLYPVAA